LGISKNTVKKYVQANTPPLQKAPPGRSAYMARFESQVDDLLRNTPKITASRIAQIIRERFDPTFAVGERAVRMYVAARRSVAYCAERSVCSPRVGAWRPRAIRL
jgi:hypothetical protein